MAENRRNQRGLAPHEVNAYELGWLLAEPTPVKRTKTVRREVVLDEYGRPRVLIEETTYTEEE